MALRESFGIPVVLSCLERDDFSLQTNAFLAASAICEDAESREVMFGCGFMPVTLGLLQSSNESLALMVTKVLRAVTDHHAENTATALELHAIPLLMQVLGKKYTSPGIVDNISYIIVQLRSLQRSNFF